MKKTLYLIFLTAFISCTPSQSKKADDKMMVQTQKKMIKQAELTNSKIKDYAFLDCMYQDSYFPKFLVDKCKQVLLKLCNEIENTQPKNLDELYQLTHSSTNEINDLQDEFLKNNSEIETAARECFGLNFEFIANAYGFKADPEELIATREW